MKDKNVAGILALFFGWLGMHRFYLGQVGLGIFFAFLTIVSQGEALPLVMFFSVIDAIVFFSQDKDKFDLKYNKPYFKKVRKERPDFDRNKKRYDNRQQRNYDRNVERKDRKVNRKPRHNPYKASGIEKYKDYDYGGAIEDFAKALEIDERDIATHFNIACAYSINENVERAFYHLDRAVSLGFNDFSRIKEHDALAYLRIQDQFEEFENNGFQLKKKAAPKKVEQQEQQQAPAEQQEEQLELPNDLLEQLNKLHELKTKGLLTEEEFAVQKKKLLR